MTYSERIAEQRAYYALLNKAHTLGIPVSLDDPASPRTIAGIKTAIAKA